MTTVRCENWDCVKNNESGKCTDLYVELTIIKEGLPTLKCQEYRVRK